MIWMGISTVPLLEPTLAAAGAAATATAGGDEEDARAASDGFAIDGVTNFEELDSEKFDLDCERGCE